MLLSTLEPEQVGNPDVRLIDPTCGSGTFLVAHVGHALRRGAREGIDPNETRVRLVAAIMGMDANPVALRAAEANLLVALGSFPGAPDAPVRLPLRRQDVLDVDPPAHRYDVAIGNPPWVNWEDLGPETRTGRRARWVEAGLFATVGMSAILGRGKKDLAVLVTLTVLDRLLRDGGRLGFILPQSVFRSAGGARGFRRFHLGDGGPFAPEGVEDVTAERPFEGAATRPVLAVLVKGRTTAYPVPYRIRRPGGGVFDWASEPVDAADPTSPWLAAPPEALPALRRVRGTSAYRAREGANTGGANAVYWLELLGPAAEGIWRARNVTANAKTRVESVTAELEPGLVHPLLRGRDVDRWRAGPSLHLLLAQDPDTRTGIPEEVMRRRWPRTFAWLTRFEAVLRARKSQAVRHLMSRGAFYTMFGVSRLTLAPHKVVWRELAHDLDAAVVGSADACGETRPVVPDHTCVFVACAGEAEAHFLCAVLNSAPARLVVRGTIVMHPDPHVLAALAVPAFSAANLVHSRLAELSREAHRRAAGGGDGLAALQAEVDAQAAQLWGIDAGGLEGIRLALAGGAEKRAPRRGP